MSSDFAFSLAAAFLKQSLHCTQCLASVLQYASTLQHTMGYVDETRTQRQDRERRIRDAVRQEQADRSNGVPQKRSINRKYCCEGCPKKKGAVVVKCLYPLLCLFCYASARQRQITTLASQ